MNEIHYLYKITNKENSKTYVGVSIKPQVRWREHLNGYGSKEIAKDLSDEFICEILEEGEELYIYTQEVYTIKKLNTLKPHGYNISTGGIHGPGLSGDQVGNAVLDNTQVEEIRIRAIEGEESTKTLSKEFGVAETTIRSILRGDRYKSAAGPIRVKQTQIQLSRQNKEDMQSMRDIGTSISEIALLFWCAESTVYKHTNA